LYKRQAPARANGTRCEQRLFVTLVDLRDERVRLAIELGRGDRISWRGVGTGNNATIQQRASYLLEIIPHQTLRPCEKPLVPKSKLAIPCSYRGSEYHCGAAASTAWSTSSFFLFIIPSFLPTTLATPSRRPFGTSVSKLVAFVSSRQVLTLAPQDPQS
jgi:hypothetical protein